MVLQAFVNRIHSSVGRVRPAGLERVERGNTIGVCRSSRKALPGRSRCERIK
jgi:hypothetical protein